MRHCTFALLLAWLVLPASALAQQPVERTIPFEGVEVFCHVLFHEDLQPIASFQGLARAETDTLLIVFGQPAEMDKVKTATGGLARFVQNGGNVLIASDSHFPNDLGIAVSGKTITEPDLARAYRGKVKCPWFPSAGIDHPLFATLRKGIAANGPSSIAGKAAGTEPLLRFEEDALVSGKVGAGSLVLGKVNWDHPPWYMIASPKDAPPRGRVLFIAGQGMFMNGMMLQTDNDNFDFAVNAVRWLREGPGGKLRSRAFFMVDGNIIGKFDMDLAPQAAPPLPPIPIPPVKAINRLIRGMEDERLFHKIVHGVLGDSVARAVGVLFALATFGLLLYGAKKFLEGRFHQETAVPRMVGVPAPFAPALRRGQQRQLALYQQADLAKESGQLVCAWLHAEFGVQPGAGMAFQASGFVWTRWRLQRQAAWVLGLAWAPKPMRVTANGFAALIDALPELSQAVAAGRLALLVDGKNVT